MGLVEEGEKKHIVGMMAEREARKRVSPPCYLNFCAGAWLGGVYCSDNIREHKLDKAPSGFTQNHYGNPVALQVLLIANIFVRGKQQVKTAISRCLQ
ncbi:MAG TPA: hypothetical protein VI685_27975 [Candidatus Angelobacter sp.]